MSGARVDKEWQRKGLEAYDTQAIVGTLSHYGVQVDEASFGAMAKELYPLGIAEQWHASWQGKGQFARLPYAAATVLWHRWQKERLPPADFADSVVELVVALEKKASGGSADVQKALEHVQASRARVPVENGAVSEAFGAELFQLLDARGEAFVRVFDELAERLARAGHTAEADAFAELEEFLLPDRQGVVRAIVRAAKGERDQAVAELDGLLSGERRSEGAVLTAVDALLHLGAFDVAQRQAEARLDQAEKGEAHHLALGLCERLAFIFDKRQNVTAMRALEQRARKLADAHALAHPHHHAH